MNAIAFLNTFEREFGKPFFAPHWLQDRTQQTNCSNFTSQLTFDETNHKWNLVVELAGVAKENLKIDTIDGYIQLSGEKTKGVQNGKFEAKYQLPKDIDLEKIEAAFENGILSLDLPLNEKKNPKNIQIK